MPPLPEAPVQAFSKVHTCAICTRQIERQECHRNRYGEYICKICQTRGHRYSSKGKIARIKRYLTMALRWLALLGFFALLLSGFYHLIPSVVVP